MKKHLFLMMTAAAAITFAGCGEDEPEIQPSLSISLENIPATVSAGSYSVAITCNVSWTAAVNTGAVDWCTVSPASGTGDGVVTVAVAANATDAARTAIITFSAGTVNGTASITQQNTPPHAAGTMTWTFGGQTWSDAIHCAECNKESFTESATDPQCRSYTSGTNTWYYYNWPYVNANKNILCPSPWRVPTHADFLYLVDHTTAVNLLKNWVAGDIENWDTGDVRAGGMVEHRSPFALYFLYLWSDDDYDADDNHSAEYAKGMQTYGLPWRLMPIWAEKSWGFQLRCVK
jgi:hypothetical protein